MIKANLIGDNIVKAIDRWQNENSVTRSRKTLFCRYEPLGCINFVHGDC